jgi:Domain of unknown function (DUF397)
MLDRSTGQGSRREKGLRRDFRKSSYSMSNGHCLEAALLADGQVGVRDSLAADGVVLCLEPEAWAALLRDLRAE